jgi:hypothetical protein
MDQVLTVRVRHSAVRPHSVCVTVKCSCCPKQLQSGGLQSLHQPGCGPVAHDAVEFGTAVRATAFPLVLVSFHGSGELVFVTCNAN